MSDLDLYLLFSCGIITYMEAIKNRFISSTIDMILNITCFIDKKIFCKIYDIEYDLNHFVIEIFSNFNQLIPNHNTS